MLWFGPMAPVCSATSAAALSSAPVLSQETSTETHPRLPPTHTLTHAHMHTHTHSHTHTHAHTHSHTRTHAHTRTHTLSHTHTCTHTRTLTHTHMHTHTLTHAHMHTHTHTFTHTLTHMRKHTLSHTNTHSQVKVCFSPLSCPSPAPLLPQVSPQVSPQVGTLCYRSPEVLDGCVNLQSSRFLLQGDVYALGLLLWEVCSRCADLCPGEPGTPGTPARCVQTHLQYPQQTQTRGEHANCLAFSHVFLLFVAVSPR